MNEPKIEFLTKLGEPVKHFKDADIVSLTQVYSKQEWEEFKEQNPELFNKK